MVHRNAHLLSVLRVCMSVGRGLLLQEYKSVLGLYIDHNDTSELIKSLASSAFVTVPCCEHSNSSESNFMRYNKYHSNS